MNKTLFCVGMTTGFLIASPAFGETWTAACQGLQFKFDRAEKLATLTMQTAKGSFPIATGTIVFDNGTALRALLDGGSTNETLKLSQVGLNRSRNIVYVLGGKGAGPDTRDSVFCDTAVTISR